MGETISAKVGVGVSVHIAEWDVDFLLFSIVSITSKYSVCTIVFIKRTRWLAEYQLACGNTYISNRVVLPGNVLSSGGAYPRTFGN